MRIQVPHLAPPPEKGDSGTGFILKARFLVSMLQLCPPLRGVECSGGSEHHYQSSQLAARADVAKLTVAAKVGFPKIWRKFSILILVGGYDYGFITTCESSFSFSFFMRSIFSALAENHSVGVRD